MFISSNYSQSNDTYVIIIGASEYPNLENKELDFSDDDAELVLDYFLKKENIKKENIKAYINKNTSADEIGQELYNKLLIEADTNDLVIIYFSGHGDIDNNFGEGYLLLNQVKPATEANYRFNETISLKYVREFMNSASKRRVKTLFLTDACRSGIIISDIYNKNYTLNSLNTDWGSSSKIVSCQPNENSQEGTQWGDGHGVFTYFLINGLKGMADLDTNNIVTFREINRYLEDNVSKETLKKQNPSSSYTNPHMPISFVNSIQKKEAEKEIFEHLNIPTLNKTKNQNTENPNYSTQTISMLNSFKYQINNNLLFNEDLTTQNEDDFLKFETTNYKLSSDPITSLKHHHKNKFTVLGTNRKVIIVDSNFNKIKNLEFHKDAIEIISINKEYDHIASKAFDDRKIYINSLDPKKSNLLKIKYPKKNQLTSLDFIGNEKIISGHNNGELKIYDLNKSKFTTSFFAHNEKINLIKLYKDTIFTAGIDGKIQMIDCKNLSLLDSLKIEGSKEILDISKIKYSNKLASISTDGKLHLWNLNDKTLKNVYQFKKGNDYKIYFDDYGLICFLINKKKGVRALNLKTKKEIIYPIKNNLESSELITSNLNLIIGDSKGFIENIKIKPIYNFLSAYELYQLLRTNKELANVKFRIAGSMIVALNQFISKTLNSLINGDLNIPEISDIKKSIHYCSIVEEIHNKNISDQIKNLKKNDSLLINEKDLIIEKNRINQLLLETYLFIHSKDSTNYVKGISNIEKIKKTDSTGAYVYNILGILNKELNNLLSAKHNMRIAEKNAPLWSEPKYNYSEIYIAENELEMAEIKINEALSNSPNSPRGNYLLGQVYYKKNQTKQAEYYFKLAYEKAPKIDYIANSYCDLKIENGGEDELMKIIRSKLNNKKTSQKEKEILILKMKTILSEFNCYDEIRNELSKCVGNCMNGEGTLIFTETGETYEGQFINGCFDGNGKYTWPNGDFYEGEWIQGKKNGYGTYKHWKGSEKEGIYFKTQKGQFVNDIYIGK